MAGRKARAVGVNKSMCRISFMDLWITSRGSRVVKKDDRMTLDSKRAQTLADENSNMPDVSALGLVVFFWFSALCICQIG